MARRVFFSFHFERDVWRANQVRNSWVTKGDTAGYVDAATFEEVKKGGDSAIKRWIDEQLTGTTVTAVLIGNETSSRPYVQYEIEQSVKRGNGFVGIYIHNLKDVFGKTDTMGTNPLNVMKNAIGSPLSNVYSTFYWDYDHGYENMGTWVEDAARKAGK
jgi:hypothetical protein